MNNERVKDLCLSLMKADTELGVIQLLKEAGYWDNPTVWRLYGDNDSNYSTIGNQQSRPDAALVEKLVNSVDHRLINESLVRAIDPEGPLAPETIQEAVAQFFDDGVKSKSTGAGRIKEWNESKRTEVARGITLAATGAKPGEGKPCFTISDCGEGQTPEMMAYTLLSLPSAGSNKANIPFVQGKFNMGSTGALKFCGWHNLQLIVSRRNPSIIKGKPIHPSDSQWSFTIVRREEPGGKGRNSIYTYLAPLGEKDTPRKGGVLRFSADAMPIFPEGRNAYGRMSEWGTLIKLYEYAAVGYSNTHILRKDGLLSRLDLLLPDAALPIRLHECRLGYRGHEGSFETTLTGIGVRLEDDKAENLEFLSPGPMSVAGEHMTVKIYAFKKGKAETYRKNEGIIFTVNGQTHGHFTTDFFRRKSVGLSYLADSILVVVDCSNFGIRAREDLFMNSRDRLSGGELRAEIEDALEDLLKHHQGLRDLKERRRREEIESRLEDSKPLEDILESLLEHSPTLSALFLQGKRVSNPFKTIRVKTEEKIFEGKRYPTYFRFKDKAYGVELHRDCHINRRSRILFETDAVNEYFSRTVDTGEFSLFIASGDYRSSVRTYSLNLQNGVATLTLELPANCRVGDELHFIATVTDPTQIEPFENSFWLRVKEPAESRSGSKNGRRKSPSEKEGEEREIPTGIQLPHIIKVHENPENGAKGWNDMTPPFDKYVALRIRYAGDTDDESENGDGQEVYDFFVNVDNIYLKTEQKANSESPEVSEARFTYGLVLLGLGLLHQEAQAKRTRAEENRGFDEENNGINIETKVEQFTRAVAPVLLPMIDYLGALDLESNLVTGGVGEAT